MRRGCFEEAVDALIDNGRGRPVTGPGNRALKLCPICLAYRRFRQNYLANEWIIRRSVIVVGPELKIYQ